jgi:hypothetical protein
MVEITGGCIFIVGHERSGTSLVRAILQAQGSFAIPPTDADIFTLIEQHRCGEVADPLIFDALRTNEKLIPWGIDWDGIAKNFTSEKINKNALFKTILENYWQKYSAAKPALKRPKYELRVDQIRQIFPDSRFIALIRDPRAVLASKKYYKGKIGTSWNIANFVYLRLLTSILRWRKSVEAIRNVEKSLGAANVLVVRYEHLVLDPEKTIEQIFSFTGDKFDNQAIYKKIGSGFKTNSTFTSNSNDRYIFRKEAIDRWKDKLHPVELWLIEKALGNIMKEEEMIPSHPVLSLTELITGKMNLMFYFFIKLFRYQLERR